MTRPAPTPSTPTARNLPRRWLAIGLGALLLAALVGGAMGVSYLFLRPAAPAAVGLSSASPSTTAAATAAAEASAASAGSTAAASTSSGTTTGSIDGTWNVDSSIGSFSDFSGSFVGYRVEEELATVGAATAVGRTPDVTGSVTLDGATISAVEISANLSTLQSDKTQRDGQLHRQALETDTYPTATFSLTQPIDLGAAPTDGRVIQATATGNLTIHGVTKSVEIPVEARLSGNVVTVTGSIDILFADYSISRPTSFAVLTIADHGTLEFQLQLTRA
ncbi:MAG TPA: YceI family protein [Candidatus Limnocylindrales bacterium]|nr:YceI family protein [Candidatus Limnocylindrales bacterium]